MRFTWRDVAKPFAGESMTCAQERASAVLSYRVTHRRVFGFLPPRDHENELRIVALLRAPVVWC